jgi:metallo-beta-lactamase family protein
MENPSITFLGATETVTGSRFLVSSGEEQILIDCGLFQGSSEIQAKNREPFPIDATTIKAIVITHAHLDHSGYLPLLVRQGFSGNIITTKYTEPLIGVVLRDSAKLQEEDAYYAAKEGYSSHKNPEPLYRMVDVEATLELIRSFPYRQEFEVAENFTVTFYPSGHILGSAFVVLEAQEKTILFTSDMGRRNHPLLAPPDSPPLIECDAIVTESTYGDRLHESASGEFAREINAAINRGGSIVIPAFAIDRTEVILMALRDLIDKREIPHVPIYVDSPMAVAALVEYRNAVREGGIGIREGVATTWANQDPFDPGTLTNVTTTEHSKSLNQINEPHIIISASGMATGGRVVHHLKRMLPDERNTVLLVGYQAQGSRGRALEDGLPRIRIHGEWIDVKARIAKIESFSVHADSSELLTWLGKCAKPKKIFVVHGEREAEQTFKQKIQSVLGWNAIVPRMNEKFDL